MTITEVQRTLTALAIDCRNRAREIDNDPRAEHMWTYAAGQIEEALRSVVRATHAYRSEP